MLGTLRLPAMLLLAGDPARGAGTNVAISAAAAASGSWRHAREDRVDWRIVAWMAPPSVAGAVVGALWGGRVPEGLLLGLVAAVLAWNGFDLVFRPVREHAVARLRVWPTVVFGFAIGVLGGALGVILGTLRMPALLRGVGMTARRAAGTNLVVGALLGVFAFGAYAARLEVDWSLLGAGLAGGIPGAWLGARATGRIAEETLRRAVGLALLAVAAAFVLELALR